MKTTRIVLSDKAVIRMVQQGHDVQIDRSIRHAPNYTKYGMLLQPYNDTYAYAAFFEGESPESRSITSIRCPYGRCTDRLWVQERWAIRKLQAGYWLEYPDGQNYHIPSDIASPWVTPLDVWRSAIYMPRWASRLTVCIKHIDVQRVNLHPSWIWKLTISRVVQE